MAHGVFGVENLTKQRSPEYRAAEWHWESRSGTCGVKFKDFKEHVLYSHMWESKSIMSVLVCKWVGEERTYMFLLNKYLRRTVLSM